MLCLFLLRQGEAEGAILEFWCAAALDIPFQWPGWAPFEFSEDSASGCCRAQLLHHNALNLELEAERC